MSCQQSWDRPDIWQITPEFSLLVAVIATHLPNSPINRTAMHRFMFVFSSKQNSSQLFKIENLLIFFAWLYLLCLGLARLPERAILLHN